MTSGQVGGLKDKLLRNWQSSAAGPAQYVFFGRDRMGLTSPGATNCAELATV